MIRRLDNWTVLLTDDKRHHNNYVIVSAIMRLR